jgi:hypothetical protein
MWRTLAYGLSDRRTVAQIPVVTRDFTLLHSIQTGFEADSRSYQMSTKAFTSKIKRPESKAYHSSPSSTAILLLPHFMAWCLIEHIENFTVYKFCLHSSPKFLFFSSSSITSFFLPRFLFMYPPPSSLSHHLYMLLIWFLFNFPFLGLVALFFPQNKLAESSGHHFVFRISLFGHWNTSYVLQPRVVASE